jgi:CDP-diacylglycerol--glycerol-3-phosphate 3-phosphatidyltransferase
MEIPSAPIRHIPNAITIGRIVVTPILLVLLMTNTLWGQATALGLFIVAAISDYVDGKLARELEIRSRLGQFLDPFADKVLVLGTFICLSFLVPAVVPWWAVALIAARDVLVTVLRSVMEARGRSLKTSSAAKYKTTFQLTFLISMLVFLTATHLPPALSDPARWVIHSGLFFWLLLVVVLVTWITGILYVVSREESHE